MSTDIDHLLGLTGESTNNAGFPLLGPNEFCHFIGILFLSSMFISCIDDMFSLMTTIANGCDTLLNSFEKSFAI
jgi:hypothetical protein